MRAGLFLFVALPLAAQPQGGMSAAQAARRAEYMRTHTPRESMGLTPLTELGSGRYKGEQGGLYPGGVNDTPAAHRAAGLRIAGTVEPLDGDGKRSKDGKVALLSIGFSNPNIEFIAFKAAADAYAGRSPSLLVINGCVGGQAAQTIADPAANYWKIVDQRIREAGATANQVQAIWMKQVIPGVAGDFPEFPRRLQGYIEQSLRIARTRFPNLKLAYLASRAYGGYTETGGSPEPLAYETGFAVKWVVADQIEGKAEMNYDPAKGEARAPWVAWGPYLWSDGAKGRADGLVYTRADYREDGLHPSASGTAKVVKLLMDFFETDPTTRGWFNK